MWEELAAAHRDLTPGPSSPSGHTNRYSTIPYAFPAAVSLPSLGPVSDVLVGMKKWDFPDVICELDLLWTAPKDEVVKSIAEYRAKALAAWKLQWQIVKKAERAAYGRRSYFYCKEHDIDVDSLDDDEEAPETDDEAEGAEEAMPVEEAGHY